MDVGTIFATIEVKVDPAGICVPLFVTVSVPSTTDVMSSVAATVVLVCSNRFFVVCGLKLIRLRPSLNGLLKVGRDLKPVMRLCLKDIERG